jgi:hypothetical protein
LVQQYLKISFQDAVKYLVGDADVELDPVEQERRRKKRAATKKSNDEFAERARKFARREAAEWWAKSLPAEGTLVEGYFALRSIRLSKIPAAIRFLPDHPYTKTIARKKHVLHRGPCMIARIFNRDGEGVAVHQTWIDLDRPSGKALIMHDGKQLPSKMVRGSKKGGVIPLSKPRDADTLVTAEGLENTLTALAADVVKGAAYQCAVDLGNIAGKMAPKVDGGYSGQPLLSDRDAFIPHAWVARYVLIQDGDSDPDFTRASLLSGIRRAKAVRPQLRAYIVHAGEGIDLNDVAMGAGQ